MLAEYQADLKMETNNSFCNVVVEGTPKYNQNQYFKNIKKNKFILWYTTLNVHKQKTKLTSHKQYLFGPLFFRNEKNY